MSARQMLSNAAARTLQGMFPAFFGAAKHNHTADFGFPERVDFNTAYEAYTRNGIANAGVDKTVEKTWQDLPYLQEFQRDGTKGGDQKETTLEAAIRQRFSDLRVWQHMAEADRRGMVGSYSALILRFADNKQLREPVDRVNGGLTGLVEVIPAWEGQIKPSAWNTDQTSEGYGQPTMFQFNESAVGETAQPRSFDIHPDRVIVWSKDGTLNGRSALEPGYNDLLSLSKIIGAGGEGFYKNAKSGLSIEIDKDAKLDSMAAAMGVQTADVVDKIDEQVESFNRGFDKSLMTQGMKVTPIQVSLPSPEHFFAVAAQSFAASMKIPMKILVGSQTGERASTEDAEEWSRTCMGRRTNQVIPAILTFVGRLEQVGILPAKDWFLSWSDLTDASIADKVALADKMADVNVKMKDTGEFVFTIDDMRSVADREPLSDADKYRDEGDEGDDADALGNPKTDPVTDPVEDEA